jgi:predicted TIM-barrel fold metal-dependent hydrolase
MLPRGAVDCHAHVFGPYDRFPLTPERRYTPAEAPFERHAAMLDRVRFDRGVLVQGSVHGFDNGALLDALARAPDRLRGIAAVDATIGDDELARYARAGVRGLRLGESLRPGTPLAMLEAFAARIAPLGWHVQLYLARSDELVALAPRIRALPVPVLVDHMASVTAQEGLGAPGFRALLDLVSSTDHLWVKVASFYRRSVTGHPYHDMAPLARALAKARPDRLVFGSNWPHPDRMDDPPDDAALVGAFMGWLGDPALARRILVDNPARLFGFPPLQGPFTDPSPASRPTT